MDLPPGILATASSSRKMVSLEVLRHHYRFPRISLVCYDLIDPDDFG